MAINDTILNQSEPILRIDSTLELINTCKNKTYEAKLEEFIYLDSNAYLLTITSKDSGKILSLDLPTGRTHIEKCGNNYILLSSACGGPCSGLDFIFLKEKRPSESYMYCHIAKSNENIITHVENEEFENLKIRNLKNGKEITVHIDTCENVSSYPCDITEIDISGSMLKIEFDSSERIPRQKQINIIEILK
ncbi:MAG: hypothetical protein KDD46_08925 [Bdellovibrionales bacterium]|nr:hypothetical protein [Bdellovibrionales bacterium]MCB9222401.1 hypothetical protein [Ignavibacteria bacterium]